ncbi:hypothetical protein MNBD_ALPHA06-2026 [hydrothermal vent metagenome]|uniref:Uncharacterized protein n=1 Tax=hydrothermal vent metagenome TaxID=652676 RepID=A0A3B0R4D2_9ZZZZ
MTRITKDNSKASNPTGLPVITHEDAAEYLADILPQLAAIAQKSGLTDLGEKVAEASSFAARVKGNKGR